MRRCPTEQEPAGLIEPAVVLVHELRQPLSAVRSFAQAALRSASQTLGNGVTDAASVQRVVESTRNILTAVDHALAVVNSHARSQLAGPLPADADDSAAKRRPWGLPDRIPPTSWESLLGQALKIVEPLARSSNIELELAFPEAGYSSVFGGGSSPELLTSMPADELRQVLLNILRNGIEAASEARDSGWVCVTAALDAGRIHVSVTNSCTASTRQPDARAFRPHFTTKAAGTGIGLTVCRDLIEKHGGQIWFTSDSTDRTTVSFTIPHIVNSEREHHGIRHHLRRG